MRCRRPLIFRATSSLPVAAAAIAAAAALAACGSNSPSSSGASSSGGHPTYAQAQQTALNFSRCMRSHGMPNFFNPTSPYELKVWLISSAAQSPAAQSAEAACEHLLPGGVPGESAAQSKAQKAALLAFARCMRSHGFPSFPDPASSGQLTPQMLANAGINLHQPALLQAGDECVSVTHGVITKAAVASAVAGQ
jgi:hypothetical protein